MFALVEFTLSKEKLILSGLRPGKINFSNRFLDGFNFLFFFGQHLIDLFGIAIG
jgi:hypothetical protein